MANVERISHFESWLEFSIWVALMLEMDYMDYRAMSAVEGRG